MWHVSTEAEGPEGALDWDRVIKLSGRGVTWVVFEGPEGEGVGDTIGSDSSAEGKMGVVKDEAGEESDDKGSFKPCSGN